MRITGGVWRSRRLVGPSRGMPLRPTPDALRERAFAILGERVEGTRVLDLFAGTGAVGLEALSRGAGQVVFVERHRAAARLIQANCNALAVPGGKTEILVSPARRAVRRLAAHGEQFGLAWADPPFEHWERGLESLELALKLGVLAPSATACLECPEKAEPQSVLLESVRELAGGASRLLIFRTRQE